MKYEITPETELYFGQLQCNVLIDTVHELQFETLFKIFAIHPLTLQCTRYTLFDVITVALQVISCISKKYFVK